MSTPFEVLYEAFFDRIEKDASFFQYNNMSVEEALSLAKKRAKKYLFEAISQLQLMCSPDGIDFNDYDEVLEVFNNELTRTEIDIIADLMFEKYLEKDFATLTAMKQKFSPTDLRVFSPAAERQSFIQMFEYIRNKNLKTIDNYKSRDRLTGKRKYIDYSSYSE